MTRRTLLGALLGALSAGVLLLVSQKTLSPRPPPVILPEPTPSASQPPAAQAKVVEPEEPSEPACDANTKTLSVYAYRGDIWRCTPGEGRARLTSTGKDESPSLSPSNKQVLFMRDEGRQQYSLGLPDNSMVSVADRRVMLLDLEQRSEREVARNPVPQTPCISLSYARFIDDTYALVHASGYEAATIHNQAECGIDLKAGRMYLIARRPECVTPITEGRFRGLLWVSHLDRNDNVGLFGWVGVVDRRGNRRKGFVDDPFLRDWNDDGEIANEEMNGACYGQEHHPEVFRALQKKL